MRVYTTYDVQNETWDVMTMTGECLCYYNNLVAKINGVEVDMIELWLTQHPEYELVEEGTEGLVTDA